MGIRPEHLLISDPSTAGTFDLPVAYFEKIGAEALVFFDLAGRRISARVAPERIAALAAAKTVPVTFPVEQMTLFDLQSGRRL